MERITQIHIIGGSSVWEPETEKLQEVLKNKCVFTINHTYRWFPNTVAEFFVDEIFYKAVFKKEEFKRLPLIITPPRARIREWNNILFIQDISVDIRHLLEYSLDLKRGVWTAFFTGVFTTAIASYLLREGGDIFLHGFSHGVNTKARYDSKGKVITHAHQEELHRKQEMETYHGGLGKTEQYHNCINTPEYLYSPIQKLTKAKIYNVDLTSKINVFEKIDYPTYYSLIDNVEYNREELSNYIKEDILKTPMARMGKQFIV